MSPEQSVSAEVPEWAFVSFDEFVEHWADRYADSQDGSPADTLDDLVDGFSAEELFRFAGIVDDLADEVREPEDVCMESVLQPNLATLRVIDGAVYADVSTVDDLRSRVINFLAQPALDFVFEGHIERAEFTRGDEDEEVQSAEEFIRKRPVAETPQPETLEAEPAFSGTEFFNRLFTAFFNNPNNRRLADAIDEVVDNLRDDEVLPFARMTEDDFRILVDDEGCYQPLWRVSAYAFESGGAQINDGVIIAKLGDRYDITSYLRSYMRGPRGIMDELGVWFLDKLYDEVEKRCRKVGIDGDVACELANDFVANIEEIEDRRCHPWKYKQPA
jgi:hypothetical protein